MRLFIWGKRMEIILGRIYYYNNREVAPIEQQGETEFYKCVVNFNPVLDMRGTEFCMPCMCCSNDGSHPTHSHDEYQEVIDVLNEEKHTQDIMFLPASMLKEHYFEYRPNETLKDEIKKNEFKLNNLKVALKAKIMSIDDLQAQIYSLDAIVNQCQQEINGLKENISELHQKELSIHESIENNKDAAIEGTEKTISISRLLHLLKIEKRMEVLDAGGVDNWDWYDETTKNHDFEKEALEELLSM